MENLGEVEFKVAMDAEQAKLKNHTTIKVNVSFEGVDEKVVQEMAMKAQIVAWQAQIRANWDKFLTDGLPSTVTFGETLYESSKGKITVAKAMDKVKEELNALPPRERVERMLKEGMIDAAMAKMMLATLG